MSNTFKYLFLPVILFFSMLAIVFWVLLPLYRDTEAVFELKKQNENNLSDRLKLSANSKRLTDQYNERLSDIKSFSQIMPEGENIPELLVGLEDLASRNNLAFVSVNFKTKDLKASDFKTLMMEIKVRGSYVAFSKYLEDMEKSLRIFDVTSVSFLGVAPGSSANPNNIDFNLLVNTYYQ